MVMKMKVDVLRAKKKKLKNFVFYRPVIEVQYVKPILGRIYLAFQFYRFVKFGVYKYNVYISSKLSGNAGFVCVKKMRYLAIPKIKVVNEQ